MRPAIYLLGIVSALVGCTLDFTRFEGNPDVLRPDTGIRDGGGNDWNPNTVTPTVCTESPPDGTASVRFQVVNVSTRIWALCATDATRFTQLKYPSSTGATLNTDFLFNYSVRTQAFPTASATETAGIRLRLVDSRSTDCGASSSSYIELDTPRYQLEPGRTYTVIISNLSPTYRVSVLGNVDCSLPDKALIRTVTDLTDGPTSSVVGGTPTTTTMLNDVALPFENTSLLPNRGYSAYPLPARATVGGVLGNATGTAGLFSETNIVIDPNRRYTWLWLQNTLTSYGQFISCLDDRMAGEAAALNCQRAIVSHR